MYERSVARFTEPTTVRGHDCTPSECDGGPCALTQKLGRTRDMERGLIQTFATRLTSVQADKLAQLAERAGTTRSAVLRALVAKATEADVTTREGSDDRRH